MEDKCIKGRTLTAVFTRTIIALLVMSLLIGVSAASPLFFFGEDRGLGEGARLTSHPNSDAARNDFLSKLINPGVENLDSFPTGKTAPLAVNFGAAGTATMQGSGAIATVPSGTNNFGRYPISGNNYWEVQSSSFSIDFTQSQVAFGFYGVDVGDFDGQLTVSYIDGEVKTYNVPHTRNNIGGTVIYYGFIDQDHPFDKVTFGNIGSGADVFAFDDFTIGTNEQVKIPEFPTVALPVVSILGLVFMFQRRKE